MFERVLVPLDRSALAECVLPHAVALSRYLGSQLILLHVLSAPAGHDGLRAVDPLEWHLRKVEAERYLHGVRERLQAAGVASEVQVSEGDAAEQIGEYAWSHEAGLVLVSSHGQSGLSGWSVSTVVQKVMMRAQHSLMIVRAHEPVADDIASQRYDKVLAPLDGSPRAESVLPLAAVFSRTPGTQLLVAHVVQRPPMPRRTPLSKDDADLADRIVERNRFEAEEYLDLVRSRLLPGPVETRLLVANHAAHSLHDLAEAEGVDLVLLSAHGFSGDTRWPYGGLVASFVAYGASPLLILQDAPAAQPSLTQAETAAVGRIVGKH